MMLKGESLEGRVIFNAEYGSRIWGMERDDSDYDVVIVYKEKMYNILTGSETKKEKQNHGKDDVLFVEVGKLVEQLIKQNINYLIYVHSPRIYYKTKWLDELQELTKQPTKAMYKSLIGMATHNYYKYIENGDEQSKDYYKKANQIMRMVNFGFKCIDNNEFSFNGYYFDSYTKDEINNAIGRLKKAVESSGLPDKFEYEKGLRDWLYRLRMEGVCNG